MENIIEKKSKPKCRLKIDISAAKYEELLAHYSAAEIKEMIYLYFDTSLNRKEAQIMRAKLRLRVRVREACYSLELKNRPAPDLSQPISLLEFGRLFQGFVPEGQIKDRLLTLSLLGKVLLVGTAHTTRAKKSFHGGILVLDKTVVISQIHYQLEFRSDGPISRLDLLSVKNGFGLSGFKGHKSKRQQIWGP